MKPLKNIINSYSVPPETLSRAAFIIKNGGIVAIPTETYYGLAAAPFNKKALARIFAIKRRDTKKPVLTLINDLKQLEVLAKEIPIQFSNLIKRYWPGPLTLIFEAKPEVPDLLTGKSGTVGVRISSNPIARSLCMKVGGPITATSANISGLTPAVDADQVKQQLGSAVDMILDGGSCPGGLGSTIIGLGDNGLQVLREGAVRIDGLCPLLI